MDRRFDFAGGSLPLGEKTYLMGILNYTPDSFSDGARFFTPEKALRRAEEMAAEGADLIDLGCCSTRPYGGITDEEEELRRFREILPPLRKAVALPLSVDTFRPAVARYALAQGADIVNDVSGVWNTEMADAVREHGAGWILMHAGGPGVKTADEIDYPGGVEQHVQAFFDDVLQNAARCGLPRERLCLDPGFGFAKTNEQNLRLLQRLDRLDAGGAALLAALSRKRFVGALSGETQAESRLFGTLAADIAAVQKGADVLRIHDVAAHAAAIRAADRIVR